MKSKQFSEEQVIGFQKQGQAGMKIVNPCRMRGIDDVTFYIWPAREGWMEVSVAASA